SCCCFAFLNLSGGCRQGNNHASTAIGCVFRRDRASVRFDNRPHYRQTHAHSFLFGGKEVIENFVWLILRQTHSKIAYAKFSHVSLIGTGANYDAAFSRRQLFNRVERVDDQVKQHLLNLNKSGLHLGKVRIQFGRNDALPIEDIRANKADGIGDNRIEVHQSVHTCLLAHQASDPANHFACPLTVGEHVLQQLLKQYWIGISMLKETTGSGGTVRDGGKRLI